MALKRSIRAKKSARVTALKRLDQVKKYIRRPGRLAALAIALGVTSVMTVAILIAAHQPAQPADAGAKDMPATQAKARPAAIAITSTAARATSSSGAANARGVKTGAGDNSARTASAVTITGCLERSDETFRLKDTAGADAPRARSWKSAFLKKGSASIEVVDTANGLKLPDHVGQRVSVTGMLVDREMQVQSLQPVALSCASGDHS
jgi:hypothetical protein